MRRLLPLLALLVTLLPGLRASAQGYPLEEPRGRDIVVAYNTGLRFSIAPGIFFPTNGGEVGFSIAGDVRYGFELGPLVLAPGVRLAGYFPDSTTALLGLGTLRLVFPLGPVGPYVLGGVGPGHVTKPSETGVGYMAGGGFMVHFGLRFGIGAEASYQAITGTDFRALFVGPALLLAF